MRLGIDLDGVVADFNAGWMRRYNDDFGATLTPDLVDGWDVIPSITRIDSMGDFWRWASGGESRPSIFRILPPFEGAIASLHSMVDDGHDVIILTTKPSWAESDTYSWLAEHDVPTTEVHMLGDKWTVPCSVYLDDAPFMVEGLRSHRPEATVCRFVRPWNHPVPGAMDVHSWEEFEEVVRGLEPEPRSA